MSYQLIPNFSPRFTFTMIPSPFSRGVDKIEGTRNIRIGDSHLETESGGETTNGGVSAALAKLFDTLGGLATEIDYVPKISIFIRISCDSPAKAEITVKARFLKDLMAAFKQPIRMKLSLTLVGVTVGLDATTILDGKRVYVTDQGYCIFRKEVDMILPRFSKRGETFQVFFNMELIPGETDVVVKNAPGYSPILKRMLEERIQCNFVLVAENGTEIHCHKRVLESVSSIFRLMFQLDCKERKEKVCNIRMTEEGINAFLKFIYYGNADDLKKMPSTTALELLVFAHEYEIKVLLDAMIDVFLGKSYLWYGVDVAVFLYTLTLRWNSDAFDDLKNEMIEVLKMKFNQLDASEAFQELMRYDPVTARQLRELTIG